MVGPVASPEVMAVAQEVVGKGTPLSTDAAKVATDLRNASLAERWGIATGKLPDFPAVDRLIVNNIGYEDSSAAGGRQVSGAETQFITKINVVKNAIQELSQKGFMDPTLSNSTRTYLVDTMARSLLKSPQVSNRFVGLSQTQAFTEAQRIAALYLQEEQVQSMIIEQFASRSDLSKTIPDNIALAQKEVERLKIEMDRLKAEYDDPATGTKDKFEKKSKQADEFGSKETPPSSGTYVDGTKLAALKLAETNQAAREASRSLLETSTIPTLTTELDGLKYELTEATRTLSEAVNNGALSATATTAERDAYLAGLTMRPLATIKNDIDGTGGKKAELADARARLSTAVREASEFKTKAEQLKAEREKIETDLANLETKNSKAKKDYEKSKDDHDKKVIEKDKLQKDKETAEAIWVAELQSTIPDITSTVLQKEAQIALAKAQEVMTERAKTTKDDSKRYFWSFESQQYIGPDGKPITANIQADRSVLMNTIASFPFTTSEGIQPPLLLNGAEQALMNVMIRSGMNSDQIYGLLKDPATRAEMSNTLAKDILTTHLWSGGRLSQGEIISIHRSEWGKGMVAQAFAGRADLQAQVDGMIGKGVMNWNEDIMAQLGKIDWKKFAMILLIIAGVVGGGSLALGAFKG